MSLSKIQHIKSNALLATSILLLISMDILKNFANFANLDNAVSCVLQAVSSLILGIKCLLKIIIRETFKYYHSLHFS